jgi:hypothetical protein
MKRTLSILVMSLSVALTACGVEAEGDDAFGEVAQGLTTNTPTTVRNVWSGKCLDIPWGEARDGQVVNQYSCHGGPAQRWLIDPATTAGGIRIRFQGSNLCIKAIGNGSAASYKLVLGACDSLASFYYSSSLKRLEWLPYSWYCMDAPGNWDGLQMQVFSSCHAGNNQKWDIVQ